MQKKFVKLYSNKQLKTVLVREYEVTPSLLSSQINKYNKTGASNIDNNKSDKITK